ncbi:MAG: hypothetical protein KDC65_01485 [Saprospiraceae bacterium]|nr:hypothetical protein [Saprospiraceae bacterium]
MPKYAYMGFISRVARSIGWSGSIVFALTLAIYVMLYSRHVLLDITAQVQTILKVCDGRVALPPTALFYVLTWVFALGQCDFVLLMGASAVVLSVAITARWWVTRSFIHDYFHDAGNIRRTGGWLALLLAFTASLPTFDWWLRGQYLIGQASPNYWMNGTVLVSWPFAVMLFKQSFRQLQQPAAGWWWQMLIWLLLLLISKPAYGLVFATVYPVFLIGRHGFVRAAWWQLLALGIFGLYLILEYYLVFLQESSVYVRDFNRGRMSGVQICLFCVWRMYASNIPLSVLASAAFPFGVAIAYWRSLRHKLLFWYAWAGFFAALLIGAAFIQTGDEYYTWAFRFQNYIASYLLFTVSAMFVLEQYFDNANRPDARIKWLAFLFLCHLISGIVYLANMWWTRSHY